MKEIVKVTATFLANAEVADQIVGDTEPHTVASEPYMGKGRLFGFSGWNSKLYIPIGPRQNFGNWKSESSEPDTDKK